MTTNSNDFLVDANTMHQINMLRLSENSAQDFITYLREARNEVNKQLLVVDSINTRKHLNELNDMIEDKLQAIYGRYSDNLMKNNNKIIGLEYEFQSNILTETIKSIISETIQHFIMPSRKKTISAASNFPMNVGSKGAAVFMDPLISGFAKQEATRTKNRITAGFFNNETPQQIARAITGTSRNKFKDGLLNITRANASTIAKTTMSHMQHRAKEAVYEANDDIIQEYEIVATLDTKTSATCRSLDGQIFPIGRGPKPPFHPNCRTTTAPILIEKFRIDEPSATRVSETGDTSATTTYYTWLKRQPAEFQDEALGPTQGTIFRNAGLSPEEFRKASVDRFYKPITIEQMAAKDSRIAEYLGRTE